MGFMQQGKATKINAARHWAAALALAGAAWAGAGAAWAASIPFEGRQVEMTAREQPVASFLQDFFWRSGHSCGSQLWRQWRYQWHLPGAC